MYYALMLLQASSDDVVREMERLQRNFTFLNSALWVAWLILVIYVLMMVSRERKLKREIAGLKAMMEDKPRSEEHTSEIQSLRHLVCRLLLEKRYKPYLVKHCG